jgi:hypothetical protein
MLIIMTITIIVTVVIIVLTRSIIRKSIIRINIICLRVILGIFYSTFSTFYLFLLFIIELELKGERVFLGPFPVTRVITADPKWRGGLSR